VSKKIIASLVLASYCLNSVPVVAGSNVYNADPDQPIKTGRSKASSHNQGLGSTILRSVSSVGTVALLFSGVSSAGGASLRAVAGRTQGISLGAAEPFFGNGASSAEGGGAVARGTQGNSGLRPVGDTGLYSVNGSPQYAIELTPPSENEVNHSGPFSAHVPDNTATDQTQGRKKRAATTPEQCGFYYQNQASKNCEVAYLVPEIDEQLDGRLIGIFGRLDLNGTECEKFMGEQSSSVPSRQECYPKKYVERNSYVARDTYSSGKVANLVAEKLKLRIPQFFSANAGDIRINTTIERGGEYVIIPLGNFVIKSEVDDNKGIFTADLGSSFFWSNQAESFLKSHAGEPYLLGKYIRGKTEFVAVGSYAKNIMLQEYEGNALESTPGVITHFFKNIAQGTYNFTGYHVARDKLPTIDISFPSVQEIKPAPTTSTSYHYPAPKNEIVELQGMHFSPNIGNSGALQKNRVNGHMGRETSPAPTTSTTPTTSPTVSQDIALRIGGGDIVEENYDTSNDNYEIIKPEGSGESASPADTTVVSPANNGPAFMTDDPTVTTQSNTGSDSSASWSTGAIVGVTVGAGVAVLTAAAAAVLWVCKRISSKRKVVRASATRAEVRGIHEKAKLIHEEKKLISDSQV
jgi:hypothetical protein